MKIAIQGHPTRGKEVIQILKSLGGQNREELTGRRISQYYFINCNGNIDLNLKINLLNRKFYTLEEFEKEFPFKIGDEVTIAGLPDFPKIITQMVWDCDEILYSFEGLNNTWFGAKALKKFEMKKERNITLTLEKAKEWYKKGGDLKQVALQAFNEKELTEVELPESWEEFCEKHSKIDDKEYFIDSDSNIVQVTAVVSDHRRLQNGDRNICPSIESAEAHLAMIQLEQLRDYYRGLFITVIGMPVWNISMYNGKPHIFQAIWGMNHSFLSFQSREVAEKYLKNFKPLIEKAGDLIS